MTDLERIGQRLVTGFPGTALTPELVQVVKEYKIGNIILFRENIASADQLRTLCADLQTLIRSETGHDAFIMIDQEGGAVTRLPESCINVPGSMALAATAAGADGLMIEVHNDPKRALCDGAQSLTWPPAWMSTATLPTPSSGCAVMAIPPPPWPSMPPV